MVWRPPPSVQQPFLEDFAWSSISHSLTCSGLMKRAQTREGRVQNRFAPFDKHTEIKVLVRSDNLVERRISHSDLDGEEAEFIFQV